MKTFARRVLIAIAAIYVLTPLILVILAGGVSP